MTMYPDYVKNPGEIVYVTNPALTSVFGVNKKTDPSVFGKHYKLNYNLQMPPVAQLPG